MKDIVEDSLTRQIIDKIYPEIKEKALEECSTIVKDLTKNITKVEIVQKDMPIKTTTQITHSKFKDLLLLISNNIPAMLTGGAGSGKSSTCEKVAKALGLDFYFSNAITQEYKLTGFIDANGTYQETQFYKAFKDGGLFVLDEIDASVPEALIIINKVTANEKFRIIACANTYGLGSDDIYVGRNQLDAASLDRFAIVKFDYDPELEKNLAKDKEWVEFIQLFRKQIIKRKIKHIVSMRAIIYGDKLLNAGTDIEKVLNEIVFKNLELEDIKSIGRINDKVTNKYIKIYNKIIEK